MRQLPHQQNIYRRTGARVISPSSGVRPGARALNLELPTSFGLRLFMGALCLLAGSFLFSNIFFSHSAYAASYINVSSGSGGTVSFGSIKPTSTGTSATASDTLTVHTDCGVGYSVYVSGQNGKDTNLTNKTASSDNVISTSSNAIGSAGSLSSNTWGLNYENTGTYVGLPTYADATNKALTTKTSVDEESTVPIYYGIKVDTSITPGTYTGDVLYTVLMDSSCQAYTVVFNSNGGTGTMANQSIMAGTTTALTANSFTRTSYTFLGWSKSANGKTGTATNGIGTEVDVDYADKAEVTNLTTGGSSITLYAIWGQDVAMMQGWTGCSSLAVGESVTLEDIRDNRKYAVKKLPDGKCWMVQNLTIGSTATADTGLALTKADTNIDNDNTYYLPPANKQSTGIITQLPNVSGTPGDSNFVANNADDTHAKTRFRTKDDAITNDSDTGYYNFYTATLGFSSYYGSVSSGSSTRDICPKGWRLPNVTDGGRTVYSDSAEFTVLTKTYDADAEWSGSSSGWRYYTQDSEIHDGIHTGVATNGNDYAGFSYAGNYEGTSLDNLGLYGIYWSSSVYTTDATYDLRFSSSEVYPQSIYYAYGGFPIRCLAQNKYIISYSNGGATSGVPSKITDGTQGDGTTITLPTVGTMIKSGYEFKGWALTSNAAETTYQADGVIRVSALATAAQAAGQTVTDGGAITLYPVWTPNASGDMQSWAGCASLATNGIVYLSDNRDNNVYAIKKLKDGNCWMVENLRLVGERTLTPSDSDVSSDFTLTASTVDPNTTQWCTTNDLACNDKPQVYYNPSEASSGTKSSRYGALYNWYTATAGTGTYSLPSGNASSSVCPKGWRLPTGGPDGGFVALDIAWGGTGENRTDANTYNTFMNTYTSGDNGGFGLAGYISGYVFYVSLNGGYWSSIANNSNNAYHLGFVAQSTYVQLQGSINKYYGLSVRCIARDTRSLSDITYMQNINGDIVHNTATNAYAQLTDSRDNNKYYVKKLADGKLWMVQNLRLVGSRTLTPANSDVATNFTLTASAGSSGWCITNDSACNDQSMVYYDASKASTTTDASYYGALYNWYAATAGTGTYSLSSGNATSSICPKGWRLPKGGSDKTTNEFSALDIAWGGTGLNREDANTYSTFTGAYTNGSNGSFGLAGLISFSMGNVGRHGAYWSSTAGGDSGYGARGLYLLSASDYTRMNPQSVSHKYVGLSVRCIATP